MCTVDDKTLGEIDLASKEKDICRAFWRRGMSGEIDRRLRK
jgi:hypothetical protein